LGTYTKYLSGTSCSAQVDEFFSIKIAGAESLNSEII
jgi:hypothetical protein